MAHELFSVLTDLTLESEIKLPNGKFRSCTTYGGYTLMYHTADSETICDCCANIADFENPVVACSVYWEGPTIYCDACGCDVESSYGDPTK